MSKTLTELEGPVSALFTDLDGTMATDGKLSAIVLEALEALCAIDLPVVLVTGRPAGWGHALASLLPFAAVVTENGGVSFVPDGGVLRKVIALPLVELQAWRTKMFAAAKKISQDFEGARLSGDSAYREVDLAIDWNEEAHLDADDADRIVTFLHEQGLAASRSSVHVNYGPPGITKWVACESLLSSSFPTLAAPYDEVVYVGDSLNDAPMFAALANSVGVANVRERWDSLPDKPTFVTKASEGEGVCELIARILEIRG